MIIEVKPTQRKQMTGLLVIIAIMAIFLPSIMKKSNHRLEESMRVSMSLPKKPLQPEITIPDERSLFSNAQQSLQSPNMRTEPIKNEDLALADVEPLAKSEQHLKTKEIFKAEPFLKPRAEKIQADDRIELSLIPKIELPLKLIEESNQKTVASLELKKPEAPAVLRKEIKPIKLAKHKVFTVQLGSFSKEQNAKILVARLKTQGYRANYSKFNLKQGPLFKVFVGELNERVAAIHLQRKLASNTQLQGMIVQTELG